MMGISFDGLKEKAMDLIKEIKRLRKEKMEGDRQLTRRKNRQSETGSRELKDCSPALIMTL